MCVVKGPFQVSDGRSSQVRIGVEERRRANIDCSRQSTTNGMKYKKFLCHCRLRQRQWQQKCSKPSCKEGRAVRIVSATFPRSM